MPVGKTKVISQRLHIKVIAYYKRYLRPEFPHLMPQYKVMETIDMPGNKYRHLRYIIGKMYIPFHSEPLHKGANRFLQLATGNDKFLHIPLHSHEQHIFRLNRILGRVQYVAIVF